MINSNPTCGRYHLRSRRNKGSGTSAPAHNSVLRLPSIRSILPVFFLVELLEFLHLAQADELFYHPSHLNGLTNHKVTTPCGRDARTGRVWNENNSRCWDSYAKVKVKGVEQLDPFWWGCHGEIGNNFKDVGRYSFADAGTRSAIYDGVRTVSQSGVAGVQRGFYPSERQLQVWLQSIEQRMDVGGFYFLAKKCVFP